MKILEDCDQLICVHYVATYFTVFSNSSATVTQTDSTSPRSVCVCYSGSGDALHVTAHLLGAITPAGPLLKIEVTQHIRQLASQGSNVNAEFFLSQLLK
jgi:hypothetical protein